MEAALLEQATTGLRRLRSILFWNGSEEEGAVQ